MDPAPARLGQLALASICLVEFVTLASLIVPLIIGLPVMLLMMDDALGAWTYEQALALITAVGAAGAMIANVGFGWLSDRTQSRSVGRLPWIAGGAAVGGACVWETSNAGSVAALVLWWTAAQVSYNAAFSALFGTLADLAGPEDRARASGWFAASATGTIIVAMAVVAFLEKSTFFLFQFMPLLSIPVVAGSLLILGRSVRSGATPVPPTPAVAADSDSTGWRAQFVLLVVQRVFTQFGHAFALLYTVFYLVRRFGMEAEPAATWASSTAAGAALAGMIAAVFAGRWVVRLGATPRPMRVGISLILLGLVMLIGAPSPPSYVVAVVLVGLGYGMYTSVDFALVLRVVPPPHAARYLGLFNVARTLPQTLTPAVAPLLLAIGSDLTGVDRSQNFTAFYTAGVVLALVSLLLVSKLRVKSPDQAVI